MSAGRAAPRTCSRRNDERSTLTLCLASARSAAVAFAARSVCSSGGGLEAVAARDDVGEEFGIVRRDVDMAFAGHRDERVAGAGVVCARALSPADHRIERSRQPRSASVCCQSCRAATILRRRGASVTAGQPRFGRAAALSLTHDRYRTQPPLRPRRALCPRRRQCRRRGGADGRRAVLRPRPRPRPQRRWSWPRRSAASRGRS